MDKVAIARVALTNREHIIAPEARGKGMVGMLPRCPYEIRDKNEYFDDIQHVKVTKEMLDLAKHVVETKSGDFAPEKFEDRYEHALVELLNQKRKGEPIRTRGEAPRHRQRRQPDGRAAQEPERRRQARCPATSKRPEAERRSRPAAKC
jgi:DNA end-binding protein Ku